MNTNQLDTKMTTKQVVAAAKKWLKNKGYNDVIVHYTRGTFHVTNAGNYMMSAKYVLESATGLPFISLNSYMAQIIYTNLI